MKNYKLNSHIKTINKNNYKFNIDLKIIDSFYNEDLNIEVYKSQLLINRDFDRKFGKILDHIKVI